MPEHEQKLPSIGRMAGPLIVSFWMRAAFTLVDTIFAATIGDDAVGAIGLTVPFEYLMIAAWVGLSTGLTSRLSHAMGAKAGARIEQYVRMTKRLVLVIGPVFVIAAAGIWFLTPMFGLDQGLSDSFRLYGTILIGGAGILSFWSSIPDSIVKAHQDTRSTMWAGITSNVINVSLNAFFLFVMEWGIVGIALSTVLGRIGGLTYATLRARMHERRRVASGEYNLTDVDERPLWSLLTLGVPASLTFSFMAVESALVNGLLASLADAEAAIAAYSIFHRVVLFTVNPVVAFGVAMLPFAARRFGDGDIAGVRAGVRQALLLSGAYVVLVATPVLLLSAPWIADALAETEQTAQYARVILRLGPLSCLGILPFVLFRPVFEALGRGQPGLLMGMLRYLVLAAPACWAGMATARAMGVAEVVGLVGGLIVASVLTSAAFAVWLMSALPSGVTEPSRAR